MATANDTRSGDDGYNQNDDDDDDDVDDDDDDNDDRLSLCRRGAHGFIIKLNLFHSIEFRSRRLMGRRGEAGDELGILADCAWGFPALLFEGAVNHMSLFKSGECINRGAEISIL